MTIKNLDHPDYPIVLKLADIPSDWEGDLIKITQVSGSTETRQYHLPVAAVDPVPSDDPHDYPLPPVQFFAMLGILGISREDVEAAIDDAIADNAKRIFAKEVFRNITIAHRDNPLFAKLGPVLNLDDAAIDAAWLQAKDLTLDL